MSIKSEDLRFYILVAVVIGWMYYTSNKPQPAPAPTPAPVVYGELATMFQGHPERAEDAVELFRGVADVLTRDTGVVQTTSDLRQFNELAGKLRLNGETPIPALAGVPAAMETRLSLAIGKEAKRLDQATKNAAINVYTQAATEIEGTL